MTLVKKMFGGQILSKTSGGFTMENTSSAKICAVRISKIESSDTENSGGENFTGKNLSVRTPIRTVSVTACEHETKNLCYVIFHT